MKICFINLLFSKEGQSGGLGAHIASLSSALAEAGHDVTVVTSGIAPDYKRDGVRIVSLGNVDRYSGPGQLLNPVFFWRRLRYMLRLTRYVLASRFDVAEVADGGLEQLLLAIHRNCALVTKLHGNFRFAFSHVTLLSALIEKLEGWAVRRSDHIYSSTLQYAGQIARAYGIAPERIKIIPCGIDLSRIRSFQPQDLTEKHPLIKGKRLVFLSVGSSPQRKGALVFLEAARLAQAPDLLFVLSCEEMEFLKTALIPDNVLLLSKLTQLEFYSWIRASELIVFPSTAESFSIAMHEAMLLGKTLVISPFVPFEGIDLEYPRYLVLPKLDAGSLANAICAITAGRQQFPEVSKELFHRLNEYYDIGRVARDTENLYREACAGVRSPQSPASVLR